MGMTANCNEVVAAATELKTEVRSSLSQPAPDGAPQEHIDSRSSEENTPCSETKDRTELGPESKSKTTLTASSVKEAVGTTDPKEDGNSEDNESNAQNTEEKCEKAAEKEGGGTCLLIMEDAPFEADRLTESFRGGDSDPTYTKLPYLPNGTMGKKGNLDTHAQDKPDNEECPDELVSKSSFPPRNEEPATSHPQETLCCGVAPDTQYLEVTDPGMPFEDPSKSVAFEPKQSHFEYSKSCSTASTKENAKENVCDDTTKAKLLAFQPGSQADVDDSLNVTDVQQDSSEADGVDSDNIEKGMKAGRPSTVPKESNQKTGCGKENTQPCHGPTHIHPEAGTFALASPTKSVATAPCQMHGHLPPGIQNDPSVCPVTETNEPKVYLAKPGIHIHTAGTLIVTNNYSRVTNMHAIEEVSHTHIQRPFAENTTTSRTIRGRHNPSVGGSQSSPQEADSGTASRTERRLSKTDRLDMNKTDLNQTKSPISGYCH